MFLMPIITALLCSSRQCLVVLYWRSIYDEVQIENGNSRKSTSFTSMETMLLSSCSYNIMYVHHTSGEYLWCVSFPPLMIRVH